MPIGWPPNHDSCCTTTWQILTAEFDTRQILDLIFTAGSYDTLARMFKSLELAVDDDIPRLMSSYEQLFGPERG